MDYSQHCNFVSCGWQDLEEAGYFLKFWHQSSVDFALELALDNAAVLAGALCPADIVFGDDEWVLDIISPL